MVYHEQPTDPWTTLDFQLLEAYQIIQDEKCPQCGNPVWLCRSADKYTEWTIKEDICYASRAKEQKAAMRDKKPKDKIDAKTRKAWGRIEYPEVRLSSVAPEGATLPTRKEFYKRGE